MRIISLVPSATEIICALGQEDKLIGRSHECDYPKTVKKLPKRTHTIGTNAFLSKCIVAVFRVCNILLNNI